MHEDDDDDDESCSLTMRHAGKYVTQRKLAASLACVLVLTSLTKACFIAHAAVGTESVFYFVRKNQSIIQNKAGHIYWMFDVFQKEVDIIISRQLSCQSLQDEKVSDWFCIK